MVFFWRFLNFGWFWAVLRYRSEHYGKKLPSGEKKNMIKLAKKIYSDCDSKEEFLKYLSLNIPSNWQSLIKTAQNQQHCNTNYY